MTHWHTKCAILQRSQDWPYRMGGSRGRTWGPDPLNDHKKIGFLSNTGPDPLTNRKATEPEFNVRPSSGRQQNAI